MGCYYGGNNWLDIPELGFCGFGCSLRRITTHAQDCRQKDLDAGLCIVDCGVSSAEDRMAAVAPWRPAVPTGCDGRPSAIERAQGAPERREVLLAIHGGAWNAESFRAEAQRLKHEKEKKKKKE